MLNATVSEFGRVERTMCFVMDWMRTRRDVKRPTIFVLRFLTMVLLFFPSVCCVVISAAIPCNQEVPVAVTIAGLTLYPKVGCCIKQGSLKMDR